MSNNQEQENALLSLGEWINDLKGLVDQMNSLQEAINIETDDDTKGLLKDKRNKYYHSTLESISHISDDISIMQQFITADVESAVAFTQNISTNLSNNINALSTSFNKLTKMQNELKANSLNVDEIAECVKQLCKYVQAEEHVASSSSMSPRTQPASMPDELCL
eukprot:UN04607